MVLMPSWVSLFMERHMPETNETEWPPHLDALVAAPANHRLLFEDAGVRVLEVTVAPGERENLHHHRWPSIMVVRGSRRRVTS